MRTLQFSEDFTIDQIFESHKVEIYDTILDSIRSTYQSDPDQISILTISTSSKEYSINLTSDKFESSLEKCIVFFESIEYYEKCQECLDILNDLKKKQKFQNV
jgi:hypothetical protein